MYQNGKNISFTDRSNSSVDMFFRNFGKSHPLSSAEEYDLWCQMRKGDDRARTRLIYANMRYVVTIAKKYLISGTSFEDLLMAGSLGITRAADKFDASLGYRFISFATWYIESEVQKAAYDHLKHHSTTISLDEPRDADDKNSDTIVSLLPSAKDTASDWHLRYDNLLSVLKRGLDKNYWQGTGEMLDDFLSMKEK